MFRFLREFPAYSTHIRTEFAVFTTYRTTLTLSEIGHEFVSVKWTLLGGSTLVLSLPSNTGGEEGIRTLDTQKRV